MRPTSKHKNRDKNKPNSSASDRRREQHKEEISKEARHSDSKYSIENPIGNSHTCYYCKGNILVWCGIPVSEDDEEGYSMQRVCSDCQQKHTLKTTDITEYQAAPDTTPKSI